MKHERDSPGRIASAPQSHMEHPSSCVKRIACQPPPAVVGFPWEPHRPAGPPPPVELISGASRTRHNSSSCSFRTALFTRQTTLSRIDLDQGNCWRSRLVVPMRCQSNGSEGGKAMALFPGSI